MIEDIFILASVVSRIKTQKELVNFFNGLLTPKEISEFSRRIKIIQLLKRRVAQHQIAKQLRVGVATVTRGANEIKKGRFISIK